MSLVTPPNPPKQARLAGYLSLSELKNVLTSSVVVGAILSLLVVVLQTVSAHLDAILPNPTYAFLAGHFLTMIITALQQAGRGYTIHAPQSTPATTD